MKIIVAAALLVVTLCLLSCDSFADTTTDTVGQLEWTPALGTINNSVPSLVSYGSEMVWTGGGDGTLIYAALDVPVGCTLLDVTVEVNVMFSLRSMNVFVQLPSSYSAIASWTSSWGGPALQVATIPVSYTRTSATQGVPLYIGFHSPEQMFHGASFSYSCP